MELYFGILPPFCDVREEECDEIVSNGFVCLN
jgi:hypothetical protein